MADLAIGLSKTAIELLADKFNKAIKEDAEQWQTVERDLVFITGEFEMMQSFLDTATEEHVKNKIVGTWVRQVRNLSYDVEDCIDFVVQILDTPRRSSWRLRLLPFCGKNGAPLPVDEAVAQTTLLRARVVDVSQRNIRYNLVTDSASKAMSAAMDLVPVQKTAANSFGILINAVMKGGISDLAGLIATADINLHVASVCGTEGDLVNVAIVNKMYNDARIQKDFQCRAWLKLVHPFNPHEFLRSLMTQFFMHSCREEQELKIDLDALDRVQQATLGSLIKEFAQIENNHGYLIVLEDLCTMVQWNAIKSYLPDRKKGSRIVVLTNHPVVASQCTGEPCQVSELGHLSSGHSVHVYYKEGFQHDRVQSIREPEPHHSLFLGRDTEMDELLKKAQETRLISVWGMPGVGKSALVKAIYDGRPANSDKFKRHVWADVPHPFNPTELCHSLHKSFLRESTSLKEKNPGALRVEDLVNKCRDHLSEHVCLFVIDGVQSNEDWDWIKTNLIQPGDSGSCIIIITSEESVARHCAVSIDDGMYYVKGLHASDANNLFEKVLWVSAGYRIEWFHQYGPKTSERIAADLILSKCGGLPRVITTVAGYLARKPRDLLEQEMRRLSDNFMQEVATNPDFESLRGLLPWMHSYLHACPQHLKKYMLYLSIFPQDITIRRSRLVRRWIAEGYFKGNDSNSLEKYAEKIFDEVAALSILQPVLETGNVSGYQVNGFFREYIMSQPVEETIFFPVEVSVLEKQGYGRQTTDEIGQHLAIGSTWDSDYDRILFESLDFSRLRSLTVFNCIFYSVYVSDRMRVLRVLDLENARKNDFEFELIGKLPSRLKFLSLRGQSAIIRLPGSVGDLLQMQTLDIRDTKIPTLPPFITKLRKLQCIRAGTTVAWTDDVEEGSTLPSSSRWRSLASCWPKRLLRHGGPVVGCGCGAVEFPRGIQRLKALQTLGVICVNTTDGEAILDEVVNFLPQLKKLQISGISSNQGRWSLYLLDNNTHLESLSLQFEKNNHFVHWERIEFPKSLRSLKMIGHVEKLPQRIEHATNLQKLTLEMAHTLLTAEAIELLRRLPSLRTLRLRVSKDQQDRELPFPTALSSKLQVLEISCASKLRVRFDEGFLGHLKFHCLQGSEMQVSGLEDMFSLKQVWLLGSFDEALKEAVQEQLERNPNKPALKLRLDQPRSSQA